MVERDGDVRHRSRTKCIWLSSGRRDWYGCMTGQSQSSVTVVLSWVVAPQATIVFRGSRHDGALGAEGGALMKAKKVQMV